MQKELGKLRPGRGPSAWRLGGQENRLGEAEVPQFWPEQGSNPSQGEGGVEVGTPAEGCWR